MCLSVKFVPNVTNILGVSINYQETRVNVAIYNNGNINIVKLFLAEKNG